MANNFESFQKKIPKCIFGQQTFSYSQGIYLRKCKEINTLPLFYRFIVKDMVSFLKIVFKHIPIDLDMTCYLSLYNGGSRLRSTHLSFVSTLVTSTTSTNDLISHFFRSHFYLKLFKLYSAINIKQFN